jgi:hypothetical protein
VFQVVVHCRPAHDLKVTPSTAMSTRTALPPLAEPLISTAPAAGDGTARVIEVFDPATASDALRTEPAKDTKIAQCLLHKAVASPERRPEFLPTNSPFFGSPAIRPCVDLTRGFASPPHDGFAVLGKGLRWWKPWARQVPKHGQLSILVTGMRYQ